MKARTKTLRKSGGLERGNIVHFNVREVAVRQKGLTRLLAVLLDEEMTLVRCGWLIPLTEFRELAAVRGKKFVIRPSSSENSSDKFRPYYFQSFQKLVSGILSELRGSIEAFPE